MFTHVVEVAVILKMSYLLVAGAIRIKEVNTGKLI
jgi:hypothetical protein